MNEEGIPAYAGSEKAIFETYEVSVLLDYLQLLDNQRWQDVPLAAVLTSPFVGLSAQELAEIETQKKTVHFTRAAEQSERLQEFYRQLEHFRKLIPYIHSRIVVENIRRNRVRCVHLGNARRCAEKGKPLKC